MRLILILLAALVVVAGCGDDDDGSADTTPSATASGTAVPVDGPIDFRWEGTIAGRQDHLRIEADGSATLESYKKPPRDLDIPEPVVDKVRADLAAADLASLEDTYPGPDVSDGQVQTVEAGGKSVASENGAGPPQLSAVLADLTDIVGNAEYLVRLRMGVRTSIGPDLVTMEVTNDGYAYIHDPSTGGNSTSALTPAELRVIRRALDATPFEEQGTPGFVDSRAPLDKDQVVLAYRWLTLKDPPPSADPAIKLLTDLL